MMYKKIIKDIKPTELNIDFAFNIPQIVEELIKKSIKCPGVIRLVYELFSFVPLSHLYDSKKKAESRNVSLHFAQINPAHTDPFEIRKEIWKSKKILILNIFKQDQNKYGIYIKPGIGKSAKFPKLIKLYLSTLRKKEKNNTGENNVQQEETDQARGDNEENEPYCFIIISKTVVKDVESSNVKLVTQTNNYDPFKLIMRIRNSCIEWVNSGIVYIIVETESYYDERVLHKAWKRIWKGTRNLPYLETISPQGIATLLLSQVANHSVIPYLLFDIIDDENAAHHFLSSAKLHIYGNEQFILHRELLRSESKSYEELVDELLDENKILLGVSKIVNGKMEVWVHALDAKVNNNDYIFYLKPSGNEQGGSRT